MLRAPRLNPRRNPGQPFAVGDVVEKISGPSKGLRGTVLRVSPAPNIPAHLLSEESRALLAMGGPVRVEWPNMIIDEHPADLRKV